MTQSVGLPIAFDVIMPLDPCKVMLFLEGVSLLHGQVHHQVSFWTWSVQLCETQSAYVCTYIHCTMHIIYFILRLAPDVA